MGQYHAPASLDKGEALYTHALGDGLKLLEFGCGGFTNAAFALFIAERGPWHGDRIAVVGDYADPGDIPEGLPFAEKPNALYETANPWITDENGDQHSLGYPATEVAQRYLQEAFDIGFDNEKSFYADGHTTVNEELIERLQNNQDDAEPPVYIVNHDKGEYLDPADFSVGRNLPAIALSHFGPMTALVVLLAISNNRGGGDLHSDHEIIGSWGCDHVGIEADYDGCLTEYFTNISKSIQFVILEGEGGPDSWFAREVKGKWVPAAAL